MNFLSEQPADIPIIFEFCKRLKLDEIIESHVINHGNKKGLKDGELSIGWLAHILTESNHCKSPVDEWSKMNKMILQGLYNKKISDTDFDDSRLGRLLKQYSDNEFWHNLESSFYNKTLSIVSLDTSAPDDLKEGLCESEAIAKTVKCDSTTAYGHHSVTDGGIMQYGYSKDYRSDLPQLKLMVSVEGNTGISIASDVVPGNINDDDLYIPIIERTREITDTTNCLFCGDSKMSSLRIKANIVNSSREFYLTPLQINNKAIKNEFDRLVDGVVNGEVNANLIYSKKSPMQSSKLIGAGYEVSRSQSFEFENGKIVDWEERMLLIRSPEHAEREIKKFNKKISDLKNEVMECKSAKTKSRESAEEEINKKIEKILKTDELKDYFEFKIEVECETKTKSRSEVRNGKKREGTYEVTAYKATVKEVIENKIKLDEIRRKMGWRLYVTNASKKLLSFCKAYSYYRQTMYVIEIGFHKLKDYAEISPLFVRKEEQIIGLTRLLTLALKILTIMTAEIRSNLKKDKVVLQGLYAGQEARKHESPTAESILKYFSRRQIDLIGTGHLPEGIMLDQESNDILKNSENDHLFETWNWMISPLTKTCKLILKALNLPEATYTGLPDRIKQTLSKECKKPQVVT